MKVQPGLALACCLAFFAWVHPGWSRVHGQMYCWALDSELPVACEGGEEEEEEEESRRRFQRSGVSDQGQ